jgi:DNA (cytosine-5)-methyltransferase 1
MNEKFRVLDLFSGIGGFSLGLERTGGFETVAFCEIEPYCRRVLAKQWPNVPCYADVRELTADTLRRDGIAVDVICGGFPCQDLSFAGKRAGLEGARSGLWSEEARLIDELRPRYVIVENVPGLLSLGMGTVLGDLSTLGYDAVWDCIPASAIGAPHRRDRVWIVAHAISDELREQSGRQRRQGRPSTSFLAEHGQARPMAHADINAGLARWSGWASAALSGEHGQTQPVANAGSSGCSEPRIRRHACDRSEDCGGKAVKFVDGRLGDQWLSEPDVGRVAHGVPSRVDRLRSLGNAVVPQIPELIGRAILEAAA